MSTVIIVIIWEWWGGLMGNFRHTGLERPLGKVTIGARMLSRFSRVWPFAILWTVVCQAPLSMGFSRQEYWSGWPFPPPGDFPHPGIKPVSLMSPPLAGGFFTTSTILEAWLLEGLSSMNSWLHEEMFTKVVLLAIVILFPVYSTSQSKNALNYWLDREKNILSSPPPAFLLLSSVKYPHNLSSPASSMQ